MPRRLIPVAVAALVVAIDQVTKTWALHHTVTPRHIFGPLTLTLTYNSGAAFGLGRGVTPVVEVVVVVLVAGLLLFGRRALHRASLLAVIGMGLLIGGAVGNLVDRLIRDHHGAVIDFIAAARIGTHDRWPIFNVADAAIVVGAATVAAAYMKKGQAAAPSGSAPPGSAPSEQGSDRSGASAAGAAGGTTSAERGAS